MVQLLTRPSGRKTVTGSREAEMEAPPRRYNLTLIRIRWLLPSRAVGSSVTVHPATTRLCFKSDVDGEE